jgi:DNA-binding transcriptional ArsR family regulator
VSDDVAVRAIAEPRRREILRALVRGELSAGAIAQRLPDISRPAVSQHVRVLKDAGLVAERREGTRRLYRARPERLARVRAYLDAFWGDHLDALRTAAETEGRARERRRRS